MGNDKDQKGMNTDKAKRIASIVKFAVLIGLFICVPLYIYFFHRDWITMFSSLQSVKTFLTLHSESSLFILIGLQILQIVISVIPGQWIQFACGFVYGFWFGLLLSVVGAVIGTIIAYYVAAFMGRDAMHVIFGEEKIRHYTEIMNSKRGVTVVFLIYLIPGVPKDLCSYAAGLSDMKLKPFLLLSTLGRIPGMAGSLLIGKYTGTGGYTAAIIIAVIGITLFILGIIFRKKLMAWLDKFYERIEEMQ